MCVMFVIFKTVYFTSYANNNTQFAVIGNIVQSREEVGENLITWFSDNQMKLNPDKCHQVLNIKEQSTLKISNLHIKNSLCKKLLSINFDYNVNFAYRGLLPKSIKKVKCSCKISTIYDFSKKTYSNDSFL